MSTHSFPDLRVEDDAPNAPCVATKIEIIGNTYWQIKFSPVPHERYEELLTCF